MSRWLACALCAVAFAGCGVLDDEGPAVSQDLDPAVYGPSEAVAGKRPPIDAPRLQSPSRAVARALQSGAIGVVGTSGVIGVRPKSLETADDATLESLKWERWGKDGAVGEGELRTRDCQPTCANGRTATIPASIRLDGVRECRGRRYYASASVRVTSGEQPATYVRAPC